MKKGITLVFSTLALTILVSQEAITNNRVRETKEVVKEVIVEDMHDLVDSLQLYVCKVDSAGNESRTGGKVLKKSYKKLRELDSILTVLTIRKP